MMKLLCTFILVMFHYTQGWSLLDRTKRDTSSVYPPSDDFISHYPEIERLLPLLCNAGSKYPWFRRKHERVLAVKEQYFHQPPNMYPLHNNHNLDPSYPNDRYQPDFNDPSRPPQNNPYPYNNWQNNPNTQIPPPPTNQPYYPNNQLPPTYPHYPNNNHYDNPYPNNPYYDNNRQPNYPYDPQGWPPSPSPRPHNQYPGSQNSLYQNDNLYNPNKPYDPPPHMQYPRSISYYEAPSFPYNLPYPPYFYPYPTDPRRLPRYDYYNPRNQIDVTTPNTNQDHKQNSNNATTTAATTTA